MNGRDLVRKFFRRQPVERIPFLPTAFYQAARIDGAPADELIGEPARLSRATIALSHLLRSDAVAIRLESAVYAACGIDLEWALADGAPIVSEATSANPPDANALVATAAPLINSIASLKAELRGERAVMAVMPGPVSLAGRLGGEPAEPAIAAALRALADAACKTGAEILVIEDSAEDEARLKRLAGPIVNTGRYYSAAVILSVSPAIKERIADAQLVTADQIDAVPSGWLFGVAARPADLSNTASRHALADRIRLGAARVFVSLDDGGMVGREMPDIAAGVSELLARA